MTYIAVTALSHPGAVRDHNEDSLVAGPWTLCATVTENPQTLFFPLGTPLIAAVADGLGGHPGGEVASALVARQLAQTGLRDGPPAPDHFRLGPKLDTSVLLLGRKTWELFSHIWPGRTDDFSLAMNRMPKLVASRTRTGLSAWENSSLMTGELLDTVERTKADRDVIITGSASIVHALTEHDRVDEYRILLFPTALGDGIPPIRP